jgi:hypothetical protein
MADRYQDRPFPAAKDYDRSGSRDSAMAESDPLAELARLIGQTDPFGTIGRANLPLQPRAKQQPDPFDHQDHDELPEIPEVDEGPPPGPPSWMQRARQATPQQQQPSTAHPLHRYDAEPAPEQHYDEEQQYIDPDQERDLSRYDEALYGGLDTSAQDDQHDQAYAEDAYAYQDEYSDGEEEPRRRGRVAIVLAVLALAVFGVGGAYAYRSYMGTARSGEPPIIRADAGPTKIVPAPTDAGAKVPDRLLTGDGSEKLVPREEAPVDVNSRSGPRVVFPPLNQSGNPPSTASVAPGAPPPATPGNGTLSNGEPRKIRTFSVRGDQADAAAAPVAATPPAAAKPVATARAAAAPPRTAATAANPSAANANAPLSLAPQGQPAAADAPPSRVAATNPAQAAPSGGGAGGGYLVQLSSQKSEADAQASYKALQGKFPEVLGSRVPVIKRADLGDKGVYYRAMVGPFNSPDEASQFCGSLKSAGGQCFVPRN